MRFSASTLFALALSVTPALAQNAQTNFLSAPLDCADKDCAVRYVEGVYTAGAINSVLDHSMKQNPSGNWAYGSKSNNGGDGVVVAFNGERAAGNSKPEDVTCVGGSILLKPSPTSASSTAMVNSRGCGAGFASYDEHPGYDFRAAIGTPVKASASGTVVNIGGERCVVASAGRTCAYWGAIGIDHGNGYISQYWHMNRIDLLAGASVSQGQLIGTSGETGVPNAPHLHFEVLKRTSSGYVYVDPYGWVGAPNSDPLYSVLAAGNPKLWK